MRINLIRLTPETIKRATVVDMKNNKIIYFRIKIRNGDVCVNDSETDIPLKVTVTSTFDNCFHQFELPNKSNVQTENLSNDTANKYSFRKRNAVVKVEKPKCLAVAKINLSVLKEQLWRQCKLVANKTTWNKTKLIEGALVFAKQVRQTKLRPLDLNKICNFFAFRFMHSGWIQSMAGEDSRKCHLKN